MGFPGGSVIKKKILPTNSGDPKDSGLIPGSERSPGGRNGNPLQYSCLRITTDRGAWWATVHGVAESEVTEHTCTLCLNGFITRCCLVTKQCPILLGSHGL